MFRVAQPVDEISELLFKQVKQARRVQIDRGLAHPGHHLVVDLALLACRIGSIARVAAVIFSAKLHPIC